MEHLPEPLQRDPLPTVQDWLAAARADGGLPNPDAMALATVAADGQPAVRIVLCKQLVIDPGYLVFYTNYESAKGLSIDTHPQVAANFHWDAMSRQIRLEGVAVRSPAAESDAYFASRDASSQIGAWASDQSRPLTTRADLRAALDAATARFTRPGEPIPRPPHWGGYRIWITAVELWARGAARLHDRGRWERTLGNGPGGDFAPGTWAGRRLQP